VHAFVSSTIGLLKEELHRERTKAQRNENKKAKAAKKVRHTHPLDSQSHTHNKGT
jgi:hypothetical protein